MFYYIRGDFMDGIQKATQRALILSLAFTILLPAGIPMIIFGAVNKIWGLMGVGIAFVVIGFYATPLTWTQYADKLSYKRIAFAVAVERIYSVQQIAAHLNYKEKVVIDKLDACFRRGYLIGFIREGDLIRPNININAKTRRFRCVACGGGFDAPIDAHARCPYCGTQND